MSDQRDKILACACDLYLKSGFEGFSMRKLAGCVGVTAPALYRHYASKERVLVDVIGEAYQRMAAHLYRALEGRTPVERIRMAGMGYLTFAVEHPRLYEVLFASPDLMGMQEAPQELESQWCALGQFWKDRVRECIDSGALRDGEPEAIAMTMWAHAHGLISLYLSGMLRVSREEFAGVYRTSVRRMLAGIATPAYLAEIETEASHR
jgi:AcrR family transcriptional regulator